MEMPTAQIIALRNSFFTVLICNLILLILIVLTPIPAKEDLLVATGGTKRLVPIFQNNRVTGYKLSLDNNQEYTMRWSGFYLDKRLIKRISEGKLLTVYFYPRCYGFCGRHIYEISSSGVILLDYKFSSAIRVEGDRQLTVFIKWFALVLILMCLVSQFLIWRRNSRKH